MRALTVQFFCFLVCLLAASRLSAQETFLIREESAPLYPLENAVYFVDESGQMSFEEAQKQTYQPVGNNSISPGYSWAAYWIRLRLRNETAIQDWRLFQSVTFLDHLDVYFEQEDGSWRSIRTGRTKPYSSRENEEHVAFVFPLQLTRGQEQTVYLRIAGNPANCLLEVIREDTLDKRFEKENLYYGLYFGILIVMMLYNLFVYFSLRNNTYLYYVLSILATLVVFGGSTGYFFRYLHPEFPWLNHYETRPFMGVLVITSAIFAIHFLEVRKVNQLIYRIFLADIALAVIAIFLTITDLVPKSTNLLTTLHAPFLLLAGSIAWYKGNSSARYYVLAWAAFIVGGLMATLRNSGVLPVTLVTNHAAEVGSMLEIVLLSFALADRYRILRQEKEAATQEALSAQERANRQLEKKVQERTAALQDRNEELNQINEELDMTLNTVQLQKNEIEHQNEQIHASINYAKRIQSALLPSEGFLKKRFSDAFVLNRPRDVVSGDFYYVLHEETQSVLALADCTGHGVPGAFMSMMGVNLMERVFSEAENRKPHTAITLLDAYLSAAFAGSLNRVRDGMDAAVCLIDYASRKIYFAGAKLPLIQVRGGEPIHHKGSRASIGGDYRIETGSIALQEVDWQEDDRFFLFSDGFQDQFGGEKGKKFMSRRLRALLAATSDLPFAAQRDKLNQELEDWMSTAYEKQTDDILLIGFAP